MAWAQAYTSPRSLSLGRAQRALAFGNDAIYINPAGLNATPSYELELGYADDIRGSDRRINLSVADGQSGRVAGALALTYERFRPPEYAEGRRRLEGIRFDVASAVPLGRGMGFGAVARYSDYRLLDGDDEVENGGAAGFTFDAGLQWRLGDGIALGATIQNISAAEVPDLPRAWGAGVGFRNGPVMVEVDIYHPWETRDPEYSAGAAMVLAKRFSFRLGIRYIQGSDDVALSGGMGLINKRFSFDVGYQQIVGPSRQGKDADERMIAGAVRVHVF